MDPWRLGFLGKYSQKQYSEEDCPEKVTVRVLPEKRQIYPRFKDLVTKELGSDVCFVTMALWEAFLNGMDQLPPVDEQLEIKFARQNVQINIGCQITYQPMKARRTPGSLSPLPTMEVKKNYFFPLLLEEWETLGEPQKQFWRERLLEAGIIEQPRARRKRSSRAPPSVSTGNRKHKRKNLVRRMEESMTNAGRLSVGSVGSVERREREEYLAGRGEF